MGFECLLHLLGAGLEDFEKISVTALKIFKHVVQLLRRGFRVQPEYPADDMVCSNPVGWVQVPRFNRRLEGPDDDPRRIRAQI